MGMLKNLKLRHRAYVCAYNSFRFAARLRGDLSEFAPSIAETLESVGDELAALARDSCPTENERRQLIEGLEGASARARFVRRGPGSYRFSARATHHGGRARVREQGSLDAHGGLILYLKAD